MRPFEMALMLIFSVGSLATCETAARQAAQNALKKLGDVKPALALVLVDVAWQMLLKAHPGADIAAVQDILGDKVPVVWIYPRSDCP